MSAARHAPALPTTRTGALGAVLAAIAVAVFILVVATNGPDTGRNPFAFAWGLVVLSGVVELVAIIRNGERSVVGYLALIPLGFLAVLLGMEATGLME